MTTKRQTRVTIGVSGEKVTFGTTDAETEAPLQVMEFTSEQARYYARLLVAQADIVDGKLPEVPACSA